MTDTALPAWRELVGETVVLDMGSPFVFLGRLVECSQHCLILEDADAHDLRDTTTTREKYVLDSRLHGISANRRKVFVRAGDIVGVSRIEDVIVD